MIYITFEVALSKEDILLKLQLNKGTLSRTSYHYFKLRFGLDNKLLNNIGKIIYKSLFR